MNNALRRKECYDEAVRVQKVFTGTLVNSKHWFPDWTDWDPISSGDNDLPSLDDISRSLACSEGTVNNEKSPDEMISDGIVHRKEESFSKSYNTGEKIMGTDGYDTSAVVNEVSSVEDEILRQCTAGYEGSKLINTEKEKPNCSFMEINQIVTEDPGPELNHTQNSCEGIYVELVNSPSFPDGISYHEFSEKTKVSMVDSTYSLETLVSVDEVKASPASFVLARQTPKKGEICFYRSHLLIFCI